MRRLNWAFAAGTGLLGLCVGLLLNRQLQLRTLEGEQLKQIVKVEDGGNLKFFLKQMGYSCIALDRSRSGFLTVQGTAGKNTLRLILDSGSPVTCVDPERTKGMNLKWHKLVGVVPADNPPMWDTTLVADLEGLDLEGFKTVGVRVGTFRVSVVNEWLELSCDSPVDGVLGGDILTAHSALIDYPGRQLYLRSDKR